MLVHPVVIPGSGTRSWTVLGDDDAPVVVRSLERLCALCQLDGSWVSEDGDAYHVEATLQALRALLHYGGDIDEPGGAGEDLPEANFADEGIRG